MVEPDLEVAPFVEDDNVLAVSYVLDGVWSGGGARQKPGARVRGRGGCRPRGPTPPPAAPHAAQEPAPQESAHGWPMADPRLTHGCAAPVSAPASDRPGFRAPLGRASALASRANDRTPP